MDAEILRTLAHRWIREGWQKGNTAIVDELHAANFVDHSSSGRSGDREGFKQGILDLYHAFPDFHAEVEDLILDRGSGKVAIRWTARGTHRAPFLGMAVTGRLIRFHGLEIVRFEEGKIVERWGEWNGTEILQQLGALPVAGTEFPE